MILSDGKYEFKLDTRGVLVCLRHGQPWRDFVGDNAVLALYQRTLLLEEKLLALHR